jgi:hypothetical protein
MIVTEGSPVLHPPWAGWAMQDDSEIGVQTFTEAARFIAAQDGGADRILREHRADAQGLCRGCTTPGTGTPFKRWPCSVAQLAQVAARL